MFLFFSKIKKFDCYINSNIGKMLKNLLKLLFPSICCGCNQLLIKNEKILCVKCIHDLPLTHNYLLEENETKNKFYGSVEIEFACSMLYFHNQGIAQNLIHHLKYKNRQDIGNYLGKLYSINLIDVTKKHQFDLIIPVPLHRKRFKQRGYNQLTTFGKTLSENLKIPYSEDILMRNHYSKTQTKKGKQERFKEQNLFSVIPSSSLNNKHLLLIDDVITTGATIESCIKALNKISNIKISILTIAYTQS